MVVVVVLTAGSTNPNITVNGDKDRGKGRKRAVVHPHLSGWYLMAWRRRGGEGGP